MAVEVGGRPGAGRRHAGDVIDPQVGRSQTQALGTHLRAYESLLRVHAADAAQAEAAVQAVLAAITVADETPDIGPVVIATLTDAAA